MLTKCQLNSHLSPLFYSVAEPFVKLPGTLRKTLRVNTTDFRCILFLNFWGRGRLRLSDTDGRCEITVNFVVINSSQLSSSSDWNQKSLRRFKTVLPSSAMLDVLVQRRQFVFPNTFVDLDTINHKIRQCYYLYFYKQLKDLFLYFRRLTPFK